MGANQSNENENKKKSKKNKNMDEWDEEIDKSEGTDESEGIDESEETNESEETYESETQEKKYKKTLKNSDSEKIPTLSQIKKYLTKIESKMEKCKIVKDQGKMVKSKMVKDKMVKGKMVKKVTKP